MVILSVASKTESQKISFVAPSRSSLGERLFLFSLPDLFLDFSHLDLVLKAGFLLQDISFAFEDVLYALGDVVHFVEEVICVHVFVIIHTGLVCFCVLQLVITLQGASSARA